MIFGRLSNLCNSLAFLSACSVEDHSNPCHLETSNPGILEPSEITLAQLEMTHLFYPNKL
jgi:hypothetical protein